jgi:hypothetical protein
MANILLSGSIGPGGSFAILGAVAPEVVGNVDLVLSTAQAQNAYLKITSDGSSTGVLNVLGPLIEGTFFFVENATSEGFGIVFKGASGTGVPVPNGSTVLVSTDGVNYTAPGGGGLPNPFLVPAASGAVNSAGSAPVNWEVQETRAGSHAAANRLRCAVSMLVSSLTSVGARHGRNQSVR